MPIYVMTAFTSFVVILIAVSALILIRRANRKIENKNSINTNPDENGSNETQTEEVKWRESAKGKEQFEEGQNLFPTQIYYQNEHLYDVVPNRSKVVSAIYDDSYEQNLIAEPIYDRPKPRHLKE